MAAWSNGIKYCVTNCEKDVDDFSLLDRIIESEGFFQHTCSGNTMLHFAALSQESTSVLEYLLTKIINIDITNNNNETPLHLACKNGNLEVCKLLIEYKANVYAKDLYNIPLHFAIECGNIHIVEYFVENYNKDILELKNKNNLSCLGVACFSEELEIVKYLLNSGARIDDLLLILAKEKESSPVLKILLQYRKRNHAISYDDNKRNPLHYAILHNRYRNSKTLFQVQSWGTIKDKKGKTPLDCISNSSKGKLKQLVKEKKYTLTI